ncbi:MAG TPA: hypothetical protein VGS19_01415 [Streptosporangiaceae bacterium]|nr:hypothetical protein [Streptosporangiaceae bacterium]
MHLLKRLAVGLAVAGLSLGLTATAASAATGPHTSRAASIPAQMPTGTVPVLRQHMTLDCVHMSARAHRYAVEHRYCSATSGRPGHGANPYVTGNCGDSYIYLNDEYDGGGADVFYGFDSSLGTVAYRSLSVGWYNNSDYSSGGFGDSGWTWSSSYWADPPIYPHVGYVTAWLGGTVTLWWGGRCTLLSPWDTNWIT